METLLSQSSKPIHTLSQLNQILLKESYPEPPSFLLKWEQELLISLEDMEWEKVFTTYYRLSISSQAQE